MDDRLDIQTRQNYFSFPVQALEDQRLKGTDLCVLISLFSFVTPFSRKVNINLEQIISRARIDKNLVHKGLKRLEKFNWLKIVNDQYIINIPYSD